MARHPSFTPEQAARVVRGLKWGELRAVWEASVIDLDHTRTLQTRTALVVLRAAILDEMVARHPRTFDRWYREQQHQAVPWTRRVSAAVRRAGRPSD